MRRSGIVIGFPDERTAVILTQEFTFVRVLREEHMKIGQEIAQGDLVVPQASILRRPFLSRWLNRRSVAGIVVASMVTVTMLVFSQWDLARAAPYIYLSLDVNPSVVFTVDHSDRILAVKPLDAAGRKVLYHVQMTGDLLSSALRDYMHSMVQLGYVKRQANIVMVVAPGQTAAQAKLSTTMQSLRQVITKALGKGEVTFTSFVVTKTFFSSALQDQVSPGRLALYVEAMRSGDFVSWQDLLNGHMARAVGGTVKLHQLLHIAERDPTLPHALLEVTKLQSKRGVHENNGRANGKENAPAPLLPPDLPPLPNQLLAFIQQPMHALVPSRKWSISIQKRRLPSFPPSTSIHSSSLPETAHVRSARAPFSVLQGASPIGRAILHNAPIQIR